MKGNSGRRKQFEGEIGFVVTVTFCLLCVCLDVYRPFRGRLCDEERRQTRLTIAGSGGTDALCCVLLCVCTHSYGRRHVCVNVGRIDWLPHSFAHSQAFSRVAMQRSLCAEKGFTLEYEGHASYCVAVAAGHLCDGADLMIGHLAHRWVECVRSCRHIAALGVLRKGVSFVGQSCVYVFIDGHEGEWRLDRRGVCW
ncbi:unnamed protein product [Vitrella brassicaformis CCMP3155]|uniref:Uncharacterized protein n=1 Tax=Vitrella brassicaformis (strain CCMP3155) TaxID=1169540 RepID=A0A0G4H482_VITBC|nr:unnamed protein product [Vitrella brassicaformis CCMP3155]|eukprot:CEM38566.1 unnamed protein product [Vitrella brassicaformis CCMP3155]